MPVINARSTQIRRPSSTDSFTPARVTTRALTVARPTLRVGDLGADVETAQRALTAAGFPCGGADGQFGPMTRAAVVAFQRANGLSADGVIGPMTWQALTGAAPVQPPPTTNTGLRSRMLDVARGELGTTERTGHNDGAVLKYPNAFGRGSEAWCADFVSWVSRQGGGRMNEPYCPTVVSQLKANGTWHRSNPQPGDLVLFDWDGDRTADHIGLVESVNRDGSINTIEGNSTDPNTGRQGVFRHVREPSTVLGYGAPY